MPRTYEETHPWINFSLDMEKFDFRLWMALGEAASKCNHIAGVPLAPKLARQMHKVYLVKGAVATTAIEGNTLSEDEAEKIIEGTLRLPPTQQYLANELRNIIEALDFLTGRLAENGRGDEISVDLIKSMNRMVLKDLELDEGIVPGERREHRVVVGKYRCAPVEDCDFLLEKLCEELNKFPSPEDRPMAFCVVKAVFSNLYLVWIHPFGDGNGRTARLLELYILLSGGFPQPVGHLLSNHYNRTRATYYEKLNGAVNGPEGVIAFVRYSVEGFIEGLVEQIEYIRGQQVYVTWINYIHDRFHNKNSFSDVRRRKLIIALTDEGGDGVIVSKLTDLNTELAREYYNKTQKTLARDVNELLTMDLIIKDKGKVRANVERIMAFMPWRATDLTGV